MGGETSRIVSAILGISVLRFGDHRLHGPPSRRPWLRCRFGPWWISHWRFEAPFRMRLFRLAGGVLVTLGVIGRPDSFIRFPVRGGGTLSGCGFTFRAGIPRTDHSHDSWF